MQDQENEFKLEGVGDLENVTMVSDLPDQTFPLKMEK